MTAETRGDVFVVNGTKQWVTNGMTANYCTAVVRTGGAGKAGISTLVIPLGSAGICKTEIDCSGVALSGILTPKNLKTLLLAVQLRMADQGVSRLCQSHLHKRGSTNFKSHWQTG